MSDVWTADLPMSNWCGWIRSTGVMQGFADPTLAEVSVFTFGARPVAEIRTVGSGLL